MLETIEKLEKDIETFRKNITTSNELLKSLKDVASSIGNQSKLIENESKELKEVILMIPNEVKERNEQSLSNFIIKFSIEQNQLINSLEDTKKELENAKIIFEEKYNQFLGKLESTNMDQIYKETLITKKVLDSRTLIIIVCLGFLLVLNIVLLTK